MKNLYNIIAPVLTALMWVILVLITSVTVSLIMGDGVLVDITTAISIVVMVLTTAIWTPRGVQIGESNDRTKTLTAIYNWRISYIINNQMFKELSDFCVEKNKEKETQIIKERLSKKQISYDDYLTYKEIYSKKTKLTDTEQELFLKQFKAKNKKGKYVFDERGKFLKKFIKKKIRFEKLKPQHITQSYKTGNSLVPKNKEYLVRGFVVTTKLFWGILLGAFAGAFVLQAKQFGIDEITKITIWSCSIIGNLFTSIRTGNTSVVVFRCNYLTEKNDYAAEFFKYCNLSVIDIDKQMPKH
jgi:hypothetical protein